MSKPGHKHRFERWHKRLPTKHRILVDLVLQKIVPLFEAQGFVWHDDYAGGSAKWLSFNTIPLQKRIGENWPTVEIRFPDALKPTWFDIYFSAIPSKCYDIEQNSIQQIDAVYFHAPCYFLLTRNKYRNLDGMFGKEGLPILSPRRFFERWLVHPFSYQSYLEAEVQEAASLLPVIFDLFDKGIPPEWLKKPPGQLTPHICLSGSWFTRWERQAQRGNAEAARLLQSHFNAA